LSAKKKFKQQPQSVLYRFGSRRNISIAMPAQFPKRGVGIKMKKILEPIQIGNMWVKNRMVMAPMNTNYTNENGAVSNQLIAYYQQRAKHGVGMVVVEAVSVDETIINHEVQPLLTHHRYVPGWANLVDVLHGYGTKVSIELVHYGSEGNIGPKVSASNISHFGCEVKSLSIEEILEIEEQFVQAAIRVKQARFDAITLHAAHGYFLAQFLSPLYNHRTDQYGGSTQNRMRILLEIIQKCKAALGNTFPIMVRYSVEEFIHGGRHIDESAEMAKMMQDAGVAAIDVSSAATGSVMFNLRPNGFGDFEGFLLAYSRKIKQVVSIPVICAGGLRNPDTMEAAIQNGDTDMIALGRSILADDAFCQKVYFNQESRIRNCLCCQECLNSVDSGQSLRCSVNPLTGRESYFEIKEQPANKRKEVLVIGAGPGGMAAAKAAAERGHKVIVCEKTANAGGALKAGSIPPNKYRIADLTAWFERELRLLNVELRFLTEADKRYVQKIAPDIVVFACGADYQRQIPGAGLPNVITAQEALQNPEQVGETVVILGGGATGCETAEMLAGQSKSIAFLGMTDVYGKTIDYDVTDGPQQQGRTITVVEMRSEHGLDMSEDSRRLMHIELRERGVNLMANTMVERIEPDGVVIKQKDSQEEKLRADTVVLSAGLQPVGMPFVPDEAEFYMVGDAVKPGKIIDAIYTGYVTGSNL